MSWAIFVPWLTLRNKTFSLCYLRELTLHWFGCHVSLSSSIICTSKQYFVCSEVWNSARQMGFFYTASQHLHFSLPLVSLQLLKFKLGITDNNIWFGFLSVGNILICGPRHFKQLCFIATLLDSKESMSIVLTRMNKIAPPSLLELGVWHLYVPWRSHHQNE